MEIDKDQVIASIDDADLGTKGESIKELIEMRESINEIVEKVILNISFLLK